MGVTAEGYAAQLQALLPPGRAWSRERDSVLSALLSGFSEELARIDQRGEDLLVERDPRSATELITDWERVLGLPDECSALSATLTARRQAAHYKMTGVAGLDAASIIQAAADLGYTITTDELDMARADAIVGLDTANGRWRFVWWVNVDARVEYFSTLSRVDERLAVYPPLTELVCRIRAISPAHTHAVFVLP